MPHDRFDWIRRIKAVEREHSATRFATDQLLAAAALDPNVLQGDLALRDLRRASEGLEGTYLIRLFAEFETGLRLFWAAARQTEPPTRTRDLLDGIAATRRIPHEQLQNAHAVREYRNSLVHARREATESVPIPKARGHLCRFIAFLPPYW
jgi:hypothetical protein